MGAKVINHTAESFLNAEDIERLTAVFNSKDKYVESMRTLWALRAEAGKRCEAVEADGIHCDKENPLFRIVSLANDLIGALGANHGEFFFDDKGGVQEYNAVTKRWEARD